MNISKIIAVSVQLEFVNLIEEIIRLAGDQSLSRFESRIYPPEPALPLGRGLVHTPRTMMD